MNALQMARKLKQLTKEERTSAIDADIGNYPLILRHWPFWARPEQIAPAGEWRAWLILAGRGFGKTRTGAEWVRAAAEADGDLRIALVGANAIDARGVMVEGESGLLAICPSR